MAGRPRARGVNCRPVRMYGPPTAYREALRFLKPSWSRSVPCASWVIALLFGIRQTSVRRAARQLGRIGRKKGAQSGRFVFDKQCRPNGVYEKDNLYVFRPGGGGAVSSTHGASAAGASAPAVPRGVRTDTRCGEVAVTPRAGLATRHLGACAWRWAVVGGAGCSPPCPWGSQQSRMRVRYATRRSGHVLPRCCQSTCYTGTVPLTVTRYMSRRWGNA
jgi:hypothetical protein